MEFRSIPTNAMAPDYNPNDMNAMFAKITTMLEGQSSALEEIKVNTAKLEERIGKLEGNKKWALGWTAGVTAIVILFAKIFGF